MIEYKEEHDLHKQEIQYLIAIAFVKHLKKLIESISNKDNLTQITQSELYENFKYPDIAYNYR